MKTYKYHYVYRITNIKLKKHYYGSRSSNVKPNKDIGVLYFSSSTDSDFIEDQNINPKNYKYKVVSIFDNKKDAISLEVRLHDYFDVATNENFYNKSKQTTSAWDTTGTTFSLSEEAKSKISKALKGKPKSKKHIDSIIKNHGFRGKNHTDYSKYMMSINSSGNKNPMFSKKHSVEAITKMKKNSSNPSEEVRQNLRNGWKKREYIECPHCKLTSNNKGNMTRWHFDNCKLKADI